MRTRPANILLILGLGILLGGSAYFGWRIHTLAKQRQEIKQDYSFFNSISFGLFSVDAWREKVSAVIEDQVNGYHISPEQKKQLRDAVEKELHGLIAKTVKEIDKPQHSLGGKLKKMAFHALVDSEALQKQVPPFAETIVQKVSSPASQARLKHIASGKIGQLEDQTYDATSEAGEKVSRSVFTKYHVNSAAAFEKTTNERLGLIGDETVRDVVFMLGCVLLAMLLWLIMRKKAHLQTTLFVMSLLFALVLLAVGLTSTVIEVDARIRSLSLAILGTKITFGNQVLFFQSKSIWGIITTLLSQPKPDAVTVGILILLFILVLPFIRLTAKGARLFITNNKVINYLAFEAGKWDMADVLIVGLLMTYIGLNGILRSQLTNLNIHNETLVTATVNNSSLQPGYYIFVAYVIFEIILSRALVRIAGYEPRPRRQKKKT
jgi:paraquat-inducible protein A